MESAEVLGKYILTECVTVDEPPGSLEIDYGKAGKIIEADRNEVSAATEARVREEMAGRLGPFKEKLNLYFAAVGEYGTAYRDMVKAELAALEGKVVEG